MSDSNKDIDQSSQHHIQSPPTTLKSSFASEYHVSDHRISAIADDMQSCLDDSFSKHVHEKRHPYLHYIGARNCNNVLMTAHKTHEKLNVRPCKPPIIYYSDAIRLERLSDLKPSYQKNIPKVIGSEKSIHIHSFDDSLPMAINVNNLKEALYVPKTIEYIWTANNLDPRLAIQLKQDIQSYMDLSCKQRGNLLDQIMDIRTITKQDTQNNQCDYELIGQRGVFAKEIIPAMSIIGIYTGIFLKNDNDMKKLNETIPLEYFQDYLFRIPFDSVYPKITGFKYGNRLSLINAASNYQGNDQKVFNQICHRANIMLVVAKSKECCIAEIAQNENCPDLLLFVAGRTIPKNEQLLYDYGGSYW